MAGFDVGFRFLVTGGAGPGVSLFGTLHPQLRSNRTGPTTRRDGGVRKILMNAPLAAQRSVPPDDNADALFNELYSELHRLARRELQRQGSIGGLGVTTLLHEAYLSISQKQGLGFVDHARFMGYAARVMRGLIIDDARRHRSQKRGGLFEITALRTFHAESVADPHTLLRINDALEELAQVDPELAEIIELKFFCGLSFVEIAAVRGVSERTIQRSWEKGRLYLHHAIGNAGPGAGWKRHGAAQR
jgi:RNA polymerase sigma factor (TIGR02999 family)